MMHDEPASATAPGRLAPAAVSAKQHALRQELQNRKGWISRLTPALMNAASSKVSTVPLQTSLPGLAQLHGVRWSLSIFCNFVDSQNKRVLLIGPGSP